MLPVSDLKNETAHIEYVISDVDDTITNSGRLLPEALAALYSIKESGRSIILLTGGSAGWADVYIREWPVDGVIAESGALFLTRENGEIIYKTNPVITSDAKEKKDEFLKSIPQNLLSTDQYARLYDIAIDKSKLSVSERAEILKLIKDSGAFYAESSIHINAWFSPYDKYSGLTTFFSLYYKKGIEEIKSSSIYLGDGLNDQPLFKEIPLSIGMRSVERCKEKFQYLPHYITEGDGGYGVKEVSEILSHCPIKR